VHHYGRPNITTSMDTYDWRFASRMDLQLRVLYRQKNTLVEKVAYTVPFKRIADMVVVSIPLKQLYEKYSSEMNEPVFRCIARYYSYKEQSWKVVRELYIEYVPPKRERSTIEEIIKEVERWLQRILPL